jgi:glycosyltransferase involved in cell wall biosynthesis
MPLIILEAMAAGCAVIATDTGGCAEALGDAGVIVESGSAEELAGAIADLRADGPRRAELGRRARERVRDRYTSARMVEETLAVYEEAIRGRRAAGGAP